MVVGRDDLEILNMIKKHFNPEKIEIEDIEGVVVFPANKESTVKVEIKIRYREITEIAIVITDEALDDVESALIKFLEKKPNRFIEDVRYVLKNSKKKV